jgi:serine/threonine protein phosphatase PrpC
LAPNGEVVWPQEEDEEAEAGADSPQKAKSEEVTIGIVPVTGWDKCEWLRVGYSFGRYYVHLSERSSESTQKGWVRLRADQRHWLQPHDLFRIGLLEFQVLRFNAAVHSEQGYRATMEDEEILLQDLATSNWRHCSFFGIYDGHGGRECVSFVRQRLHMNFVAALHGKGGLDKSSQVHHDIHDSLTHGFLETDRQFLSMAQSQEGFNGGSGCAAVTACIIGGWIWCANVGDSRALLCRDGKAVQLSLDHKPDRDDEAARIEAAGGFVSFRRVLGRLAVSRAFGDEEYKYTADRANGKPLVIADPEIRVEQLTPQDEFLFMACDGLFDVFSSQEAVEFMHARLASMPSNEQDPMRAVQDIVHEAIHERRSRDNVTAMVVTFKRAVLPSRRLQGSGSSPAES